MASLGYLSHHHFGQMAFQDPTYDSNYQNLESQSHFPHSSNLDFLFSHSASSSNQAIYTAGPLSIEPAFSGSGPEPSLTRVTERNLIDPSRAASPFRQINYDGPEYSSIPASQQLRGSKDLSHSPIPTKHLDSSSPPLSSVRTLGLYDETMYGTSFTSTAAVPSRQLYHGSHSLSYPSPQQLASNVRQTMPRLNSESQVRVTSQKPKPQCWEHGCNGREFSTFSNLLRHQREKSGTATKSYCPKCGAEFTRTTARNGHLAHEKCSKQRRLSDGK